MCVQLFLQDALITEQEFEDLLINGLGLPPNIIMVIKNPEKFQELLIDHIKGFAQPLTDQLASILGQEQEEVLAKVERVIEDLQEATDSELSRSVERKIEKFMNKVLKGVTEDYEDRCF